MGRRRRAFRRLGVAAGLGLVIVVDAGMSSAVGRMWLAQIVARSASRLVKLCTAFDFSMVSQQSVVLTRDSHNASARARLIELEKRRPARKTEASDRHDSDYRLDPRARLTTRRDALASLRSPWSIVRIFVVRERGPICESSFGTRRYLCSAAIDMSPVPAK